MTETLDLLTTVLLPGVGPRTVRDIEARAPLGQALARLDEHKDLLGDDARGRIKSGRARRQAEEEMQRASAEGVRIVGRDEADYPALLRETYDPPAVLYVRGRLLGTEGDRSVAIVGSRAATPEGMALCRSMAHDLALSGATIVSGLARGIDTAAHKGALDAKGRTVAVLGSGLDRVYPRENLALATQIAEQGAVVTEFPFGTEPSRSHFPRRNRVIAGWCRAAVVVEAAARSGALVTARVALDEGRDVLAVPGHPSHPGAAGTNGLLRDGATLVRGAADVAEAMGLVMRVTPDGAPEGDDVLDALRADAPSSLEEIARRSGRPAPELLARLLELELSQRVRRLPGALFTRN